MYHEENTEWKGSIFLSIIFLRKGSEHKNVFSEKSGVIYGKDFTEAANVCNGEKAFGKISEIYDITIDEAVTILKRVYDNDFVDSIWLKECIHAGKLHGAVFEQSNEYYFSLDELRLLAEEIRECGNILETE